MPKVLRISSPEKNLASRWNLLRQDTAHPPWFCDGLLCGPFLLSEALDRREWSAYLCGGALCWVSLPFAALDRPGPPCVSGGVFCEAFLFPEVHFQAHFLGEVDFGKISPHVLYSALICSMPEGKFSSASSSSLRLPPEWNSRM